MTFRIPNPARERLEKGELSVGVGIRMARTVDIALAMKTCGYDYLFLDLEHGSMDIDTAAQICMTAISVGIAPVMRVPSKQYWLATRALDSGALGIVMPHVETADEAREIVQQLRCVPVGHRSPTIYSIHNGFTSTDVGQFCDAVNAATLVIVMLESPTAIKNAEEIAAVPGIDVLLIGTNDLTIEMGIPAQYNHPDLTNAYKSVIDACNKHGKWAGMGGMPLEGRMREFIQMGIRVIYAGNDNSMMMASAKARAGFLRDCLSTQS